MSQKTVNMTFFTDCCTRNWVDFHQLDPVDGSQFGRPWCQRYEVGRVYHISGHTSSLKGPSPQALTLLGGVRFIARHLSHLSLGECRPCTRTHLLKGLVPHLLVWWSGQQIPLRLEFFLYRRVSVFPFHGLSFRLSLGAANPYLAHL